jgi:hypothetical protein
MPAISFLTFGHDSTLNGFGFIAATCAWLTLRLAPLQSAHALFKQGALSRLLLTPFGKWARVYRLILDPRRLSEKQSIGLIGSELPGERYQAIMQLSL